MAINAPQAVKFSNEEVRQIAEKMTRLYYDCKALNDYWNANAVSELFPIGGGTVEDGSTVDGRIQITGNDVQLLMQRVSAFVTDMDANGGTFRNVIIKPSVRIK